MDNNYYVEAACNQRNHFGEYLCGDTFVSKRLKNEKRLICVLSDGMGHGVKANILSTLTASMSLNFTLEHKDMGQIGDIIMQSLPMSNERQMSYSTFTIVDVDNGEVSILEYDNPACLVLRGTKVLDLQWEKLHLESVDSLGRNQDMRTCHFTPHKEDRIIFISDGVTQSGMGSSRFMLGWTRDNYVEFVKEMIDNESEISASKLAQKVVSQAYNNDNYQAKDDTSCGVIYFRQPRKMMIATGPPFNSADDAVFAQRLKDFSGTKVVSGATTADIISRQWAEPIDETPIMNDDTLPPMSRMQGVDLVTEGILTLNKVVSLLQNNTPSSIKLSNGPADSIVKLLLNSDEIVLLVGTHINPSHHDPSLDVDLALRRTTIKHLEEVLEKKFLKEVLVQYI